jgi:hypothetical protein
MGADEVVQLITDSLPQASLARILNAPHLGVPSIEDARLRLPDTLMVIAVSTPGRETKLRFVWGSTAAPVDDALVEEVVAWIRAAVDSLNPRNDPQREPNAATFEEP